jgi:putative phage-type endonuclease
MDSMKTEMGHDRRGFLGSSDAAAVLGVSKWRSPLDVYFSKVEGPRPEEEARNTEAKRRGKRYEPYVVDMAREEFGLHVIGRNKIYFDPRHPFLRSEVDFETDDPDETCEVKTVDVRAAQDWGDEGTDAVPIYYQAQAMHSLMVTGRKRCRFFALIGFDLVPYVVERDEVAIAGMREQEVAFWNDCVLAKRPPPPTRAADVLRLFARDNGQVIEATAEIAEVVAELAAVKEVAARKEELAERIQLHMQGAAILTLGGRIIATWKEQSGGWHWNGKRLDADHPELVDAYKEERRFRVLRLK